MAARKKATRKKATRQKASRATKTPEKEVLSPTELLEFNITANIKGRADPIMRGSRHEGGYFGVDVAAMGDIIRVTIHNYISDASRMGLCLRSLGYQLRSVIEVEFEYCQDGREFWWSK